MIGHIQSSCKLSSVTTNLTVIYEDNSAYISQIQKGYIKGDKTKHTSPKFFYIHDLQKEGIIKVQKIQSKENQAVLFTKSLPKCIHQSFIYKIGMKKLKDITPKVN